jgi:hypothetical protein
MFKTLILSLVGYWNEGDETALNIDYKQICKTFQSVDRSKTVNFKLQCFLLSYIKHNYES